MSAASVMMDLTPADIAQAAQQHWRREDLSPGERRWWMEFDEGFRIAADWRADCSDIFRARKALWAQHGDGMLWVYAIREGEDGPVKIGKTIDDPLIRLKTLQCGNSSDLIGWAAWEALPGEEECLHAMFAHLRIRGEWFKPDETLLDLTARQGGSYFEARAKGWDMLLWGEE